jgi:solute carrier family 25 (mitochondrial S-adenosylmethionine transporter), member 26
MQMDQANALRLAGIFSGVAGSLFGQVPYGVLTFGSYEMYKKNLMDRFPNVQPVFKYALSAILGDLTGSGWLCPSEVVKQQMQAGMHSSTLAAVRSIWKNKGLVGFYQGYFGGVARDVPFRVAQLTSFEVTKNVALRIKARRVWQEAQDKNVKKNSNNKKTIMSQEEMDEIKKTLELSRVESAVCGAIAGTFSAAITAPLDRIKTLLMTDSAAYGGTVLSCTSQILKNEGLPGLFTGVVPRVVYIAPSVVIFFVVYEEVQQRLKKWEKKS